MVYKILLRPLLFLFDPEFIHRLTFLFFRLFPGAGYLFAGKAGRRRSLPGLESSHIGLTFRHPVGIAGGLDKDAVALKFLRNMGASFAEIGTVTPKGQQGNPRPRLFRLKRNRALINRMGFNNQGLDRIAQRLSKRPEGLIVGGNIGKNTQTPNEDAWKDYLACFRGLYGLVDYFVVNVSCPNIRDLAKLQNREHLGGILSHLVRYRESQDDQKPILLKLSPDLSFNQLDEVIQVIRETGIEGVVATNTSVLRNNLDYSEGEIQAFGPGGLSGAPLSARSSEVISHLRKELGKEYLIVASGGIMSPEDAADRISSGASLVQVYTGLIYEGPGLIGGILGKLGGK